MTAKPVGGGASAYIFPGQGSQFIGMGMDLYKNSPAAREIFNQVDHVLSMHFTKLFLEGDEKTLNQTINAQPAIMTVSLACLKAMEEFLETSRNPTPTLMAGHSLGEYTALVAAGALNLDQAIVLVRLRGQLMQQASERTPGGMVAIIGLDELCVEKICNNTGVEIANVNSHSQVVISGKPENLNKAVQIANTLGARRTIALQVSGGFHSSLMKYALDNIAEAMNNLELKDVSTPIVANCTGKPITSSIELKQELTLQLCRCVQWQKTVDYMVGNGISNFIEIGPGRVLSGLVKSMHHDVRVNSVQDLASIKALSF
jgi:[acyl-carrier-protein] S-malonyltransferase